MKIFLVGGAVRDKLMGIKPKDLDYVMVLDDIDNLTVEQGYAKMRQWMIDKGFTIWLETPDMFTIRAKFPPNYPFKGDADFVLARKEIGYIKGTRRPKLELGTLYDDLIRRDATVNAMAEDENGNIVDYFGGQIDLRNKVLRTPTDADITFLDDPLRAIRFLRFSITKGFRIAEDALETMGNPKVIAKFKEVVSQERVREELMKMMQHDTKKTMRMLVDADRSYFPGLLDICFYERGLWLKPTAEKI